MTGTVVVIFLVVYAGKILGGLPFLQLDRTGVAATFATLSATAIYFSAC